MQPYQESWLQDIEAKLGIYNKKTALPLAIGASLPLAVVALFFLFSKTVPVSSVDRSIETISYYPLTHCPNDFVGNNHGIASKSLKFTGSAAKICHGDHIDFGHPRDFRFEDRSFSVVLWIRLDDKIKYYGMDSRCSILSCIKVPNFNRSELLSAMKHLRDKEVEYPGWHLGIFDGIWAQVNLCNKGRSESIGRAATVAGQWMMLGFSVDRQNNLAHFFESGAYSTRVVSNDISHMKTFDPPLSLSYILGDSGVLNDYCKLNGEVSDLAIFSGAITPEELHGMKGWSKHEFRDYAFSNVRRRPDTQVSKK